LRGSGLFPLRLPPKFLNIFFCGWNISGAPAVYHCMKLLIRLLLAAAVAALLSTARAEGDATNGKALYAARCSACHSLEFNGVGPTHKELIGRRAGTAPGYAYSSALKNSSVVWDEANLSKWLTDPEKFIPGQKMFVSVPDAKERADLIAYLLVAGRKQ
jgi:cytochrome c